MQKNVAGQKIGVQMVNAADGSAFTGSVTVYVTGDAGTQAIGSVSSGACTHEGNGYHTYAPAQAETNYDLIAFTFIGTGAVPVTLQVYTRFDSNLTHSAGTAITSTGGRPEVNATHAAGTAWNSGAITSSTLASGTITAASIASSAISSAKFAAGAITATVIADGAIDAATFAADVDAEFLSYIVDDATRIDASSLNTATVTSIPAILDDTGTSGVVVAAGSKTGYTLTATTGLGNQTANITGTITTVTNLTNLPAITSNWLTAAGLASDAVAEIADGIWDEALSGHSTAGSAGLALSTASSGGVDPSVLADAIWDEALSGHATSGTAGAVLSAVDSKTTNLPSDPADQSAVEAAITSATSGLSTLTASDVNAQVLDVLNVDTFAELSSVPSATATLRQMMQFVFMWFRNKSTQTSSQRRLFADDGSTAVATETVSDDGTTYTKGEAS